MSQRMTFDEWKELGWAAYIREPDYRLAAAMVLALAGANTLDAYRTIALTGLASRLLTNEPESDPGAD